jgi:excisionase family DNA binding protein
LRPFLIELLEDGSIPHRKVGKHRRVRMKDVKSYKAAIDNKRGAVLDQLAADAQAQDMAMARNEPVHGAVRRECPLPGAKLEDVTDPRRHRSAGVDLRTSTEGSSHIFKPAQMHEAFCKIEVVACSHRAVAALLAAVKVCDSFFVSRTRKNLMFT